MSLVFPQAFLVLVLAFQSRHDARLQCRYYVFNRVKRVSCGQISFESSKLHGGRNIRVVDPNSKSWGFVVLVVWTLAVTAVCCYLYRPAQHDSVDLRCFEEVTVRCENGGLLVRAEDGFVCECTRDYTGENCTEAKRLSVFSRSKRWIDGLLSTDAAADGVVEGWSFWPFASDRQTNTFTFYQDKIKRLSALMNYATVNKYRVGSTERNVIGTRILPPTRPSYCAAQKSYPPLSELYNIIIRRNSNQFLPDERRRNVLFHAYYQYFVLQFFDADFKPSVSASQLYGTNKFTRKELRSFSGGKLKTEVINNEHYPPLLSSVKNLKMFYPGVKLWPITQWLDRILTEAHREQSLKWATGHPLLSTSPMLFAISTLWVREHNRVCDVLAKEYPSWTDGQLFHTAKKIVIGEMMGIMMNDVITVHTGRSIPMKFRPEEYHDLLQNIINFETPVELLFITMWPSSLPEQFRNASIDSMLFSHNRQEFGNGMSGTIKFMVDQKMSMLTHNNDGTATERMTRLLSELSRKHLVRNFNDYRRQLGLRAYGTFSELTGNQETADKLQALYDNVDDVELLPGMLTEKKINGNSPTAAVLANSFIVNSILTNSLTSKKSWTPTTFGGNIGFDMVKSANIMSLVCNNLGRHCDGSIFNGTTTLTGADVASKYYQSISFNRQNN